MRRPACPTGHVGRTCAPGGLTLWADLRCGRAMSMPTLRTDERWGRAMNACNFDRMRKEPALYAVFEKINEKIAQNWFKEPINQRCSLDNEYTPIVK